MEVNPEEFYFLHIWRLKSSRKQDIASVDAYLTKEMSFFLAKLFYDVFWTRKKSLRSAMHAAQWVPHFPPHHISCISMRQMICNSSQVWARVCRVWIFWCEGPPVMHSVPFSPARKLQTLMTSSLHRHANMAGMDALSEEIQPAHLPQIKLSRYLLRNRGVGFNNDVQASFGWILPSERSFFSTLDLYIYILYIRSLNLKMADRLPYQNLNRN